MELASQRRLIVFAGTAGAIVAGWHLANGDFLMPTLLAAALCLFVAVRISGIAADALVAGPLLFGYLVGNRGFAQLHVPGVPLLPGEAVLALGVTLCLWRLAVDKRLPVRVDAMSFFLVAWIALAASRLVQDVRTFGFVAIRDFALVYYAVFFFLAQVWAADAKARRWLEGCLSVGFTLAVPVAAAFLFWQDALLKLSVGGMPLIFVKGDVASGFMAAGAFWFAAHYARHGRKLSLALMTVSIAGVLLSNSRAGVVAFLAGACVAFVLGATRLRRALLVLAAVVVVGLAVEAALPHAPGRSSRAYRLYESLRTATDFTGTYTPRTEDLGDKPDNNQFRRVWWEAVVEETAAEGPWFGLGFGRDIADEFLRRYYADNSEDFNVRSPHSFVLTVYARMGAVGFAVFLAFLVATAVRTWRAARAGPATGAVAEWLSPWMIFLTACFGVVLEGPMGAIVFWTLLGLASSEPVLQPASDAAAQEPAALREQAEGDLRAR